MVKQAPSLGRLLIMVGFAFSCVAILLYLWLTFGGAVPLRAKGYRVTVNFPEASTLAQQADVRISGVTVGKVVSKQVVVVNGQVKPLTAATLEIQRKYAPIAKDTRAVLRQKTLLGETYVELSPGNRGQDDSNTIPDGGSLPNGQVAQTVQLDEIFRTFDPVTRLAFQTWMQDQGVALLGRGQDLNDAIGNLTPFAENTNKVLAILNNQSVATRKLVRNTGVVFNALTARDRPAHGADQQLEPRLPDHRRAQPAAGRRLPRLPRVRGSVGRAGGAPHQVRQQRQSADRPAAAGRPPAVADADQRLAPRAQPEGPVRGHRPAGAGLEEGPAGGR